MAVRDHAPHASSRAGFSIFKGRRHVVCCAPLAAALALLAVFMEAAQGE